MKKLTQNDPISKSVHKVTYLHNAISHRVRLYSINPWLMTPCSIAESHGLKAMTMPHEPRLHAIEHDSLLMSTIKKGYFPNYSVDKFILYQTFENRLVF
jgi:hypothetical protein